MAEDSPADTTSGSHDSSAVPFGLTDIASVTSGGIVLEAIAVIKYLDADGAIRYTWDWTSDLVGLEAVGMVEYLRAQVRACVTGFAVTEDD